MGFLNTRVCRRAAIRIGKSLAICALLVLASACRSLQVPNAAVQSDRDWLTEGGTSDRTSARAVAMAPPLEQIWDYNAGGGFGPGSPLLLKGAVLVGTRKGEIHGVDLETGKGLGVLGVGESIEGTPVVDSGGTIYIPIAWGRRGLHAYDLVRGSTRWRHNRVPVDAGLLLMGERLVAADVESRVLVYDVRDGDVLWERVRSDSAVIHAAPVQVSDAAFVVADDAGVVAAHAVEDGKVLWEVALDAPVHVAPAYRDGLVFVSTTRGRLIALDAATGLERWQFEIANSEVRFTTSAVGEDVIVVAASDGAVRAIDHRSGELVWSFDGEEAAGGPPIILGAHVYVGDMAKMLRALDLESGTLAWETELGGRIKSAMAARDGALVVLAEPRNVYLFKPTATYAATD